MTRPDSAANRVAAAIAAAPVASSAQDSGNSLASAGDQRCAGSAQARRNDGVVTADVIVQRRILLVGRFPMLPPTGCSSMFGLQDAKAAAANVHR